MILCAIVFAMLLLATTIGVGFLPSEGEAARTLVPMLPYLVIHAGAVRAPAVMSSLLVFASGLSVDFVTHGPLGYYALLYLCGLFCVRLVSPDALVSRPARALLALGTAGALFAIQFGLNSAYFMQPQPLLPLLEPTAILAAVLIVVEVVLPSAPARREREDNYAVGATLTRRDA